MTTLPMAIRVHAHCLQISIVMGILLTGCVTTRDIAVDYPIPPETANAINTAGGNADIVLSGDQTISGGNLTVDSVMARWREGEWHAAPLADLVSVTVVDPAEKGNQLLTGVLWSAAAFGALGLISGLSQDQSGVARDALVTAGIGGLTAAMTYDFWGPMTAPRIRYSIRPPRSAEEMTRREMDRDRIEPKVRATITELNIRSRNFRVEPTFLYGRGNSVDPEIDASSPVVIGGGITFGVRFWEQVELGLQFLLASHSFNRSNPDEIARRFSFNLTGTFFPLEYSGMFLKGGIGYGAYSATGTYTGSIQTTPAVTPSTVTGEGPAFSIGLGYDIRLADAWSIRPLVQYAVMPLGELKLNDKVVIATGERSRLFELCFSIVYKGVI